MSLMSRVSVSDNVWGSWEQGRMFVCLIEYIRLLTTRYVRLNNMRSPSEGEERGLALFGVF
jgi:hypothetical protein